MRKPDWEEWLRNKNACRNWLDGYIKKGVLNRTSLNYKLHMKKSRHNLDFANWIKDKHRDEIPSLFGEDRFYDWVISAYYYSIYHATLALVSRAGYSSKSHNATLCYIIWAYYHKKRKLSRGDIELIKESISREDIEIISSTKDLRERASYDVSANFEETLVERVRKNTVYFINKVGEILE